MDQEIPSPELTDLSALHEKVKATCQSLSEEELLYWYNKLEVWFAANYQQIGIYIIRYDLNDQEFYRYTHGVYEKLNKTLLEQTILEWADSEHIKTTDQLLSHAVKRLRLKLIYDGPWDSPEYINCKNGLFNVDTGYLELHTPAYLSRIQLPVSFTAKLIEIEESGEKFYELPQTPLYDKIRQQYPDQVIKIETMISRALYQDYSEELFTVLVGPTRSGKGTLFQLIDLMFKGVITYQQLHDLGGENGLYDLVGKRVLINREMIIGRLNDRCVAEIKDLVTHEGIKTIKAKYKNPFDSDLGIFFFLAANQLSRLPDITDRKAFFSRLNLVIFDKTQKIDPIFKSNIRKEVDDVFTQILLTSYPPLKPIDILQFAEENELLWERWADPIRQICLSWFQHSGDATSKIPCDRIWGWVEDELERQGLSIPFRYIQMHTTESLALLDIGKRKLGPKSSRVNFYLPIEIINPELLDKKEEEDASAVEEEEDTGLGKFMMK